ncbi:MAG: hypothetical protein KJO33_12955, partial [Gammaproteobacteria bacterium]|nr:hypothetical protein [Gammaproteobacteria bacterium]
QRENDLVLGTHGRSVYVLDDYSALRGLDDSDFGRRLAILSAPPGQQYEANQTPSTRFTGSGEYRADNEPYGVMITFMASGTDLPHPDEAAERERRIRERSRSGDGEDEDNASAEAAPKVEMTVRDPAGNVIRRQKLPVHQGINRIVWSMQRDGIRPMPGPEPARLEDGLPGGPEVPAGDYQVTLSLSGEGDESATASRTVTALSDPRSPFSADARRENYQARMELMGLMESAIGAVERIVNARADIDTVQALIGKRQPPGEPADEALDALKKQAAEVRKGLDELEKRFRVPPGTRGIVYNDDRVANRIGMAMFYVGSTADAPTPTALAYKAEAQQTLEAALTELETFFAGELADFSRAVSEAGIGLFSGNGEG